MGLMLSKQVVKDVNSGFIRHIVTQIR